MMIHQVQYYFYPELKNMVGIADWATGSTAVVNTMGVELFTGIIRPVATGSKIIIEAHGQFQNSLSSGGASYFIGLFRDAVVTALTVAMHGHGAGWYFDLGLRFVDIANTAGDISYTIRAGASSDDNLYLNTFPVGVTGFANQQFNSYLMLTEVGC